LISKGLIRICPMRALVFPLTSELVISSPWVSDLDELICSTVLGSDSDDLQNSISMTLWKIVRSISLI